MPAIRRPGTGVSGKVVGPVNPGLKAAGLEDPVGGGFVNPEGVDEVIRSFLSEHKVTRGSMDAYKEGWNLWTKFVQREENGGSDDVYLESLSVDDRSKAFVRFLVTLYEEEGKRGKELERLTAHVVHMFDIELKDVSGFNSRLVSLMKKSCKRSTGEAREHAIHALETALVPVCNEALEFMIQTFWDGHSWDYDGMRIKVQVAAIVLALHRGLRVSNYTTKEKKKEDHCMKKSDMVFTVSGENDVVTRVESQDMGTDDVNKVLSVTTYVWTTKTGETAPTRVAQVIDRDTPGASRLVDMLAETAKNIGGVRDDDLFTIYRVGQSGKSLVRRLRRKDVDQLLKTCHAECNIEGRVSTHSLCKAFAGNKVAVAAAAGVAPDFQGRWAEGSKVVDESYVFAATSAMTAGLAAVLVPPGVEGAKVTKKGESVRAVVKEIAARVKSSKKARKRAGKQKVELSPEQKRSSNRGSRRDEVQGVGEGVDH